MPHLKVQTHTTYYFRLTIVRIGCDSLVSRSVRLEGRLLRSRAWELGYRPQDLCVAHLGQGMQMLLLGLEYPVLATLRAD